MGKGTGLFGNFRKKVGNTVGYTLKNSNNAQTQGVRIYQPVVSNPKSDPQSAQRMKLMPLQIFFQAFSDVLNHAFEGKKVGQMNRQRFMQLNMGVNSGTAPAVQKGERILAPIKCQVSSGSLTINTALVPGENQALKTQTIEFGSSSSTNLGNLTIGEFSRNLIANNLGLEDGMELGFIIVVSSENDLRAGVPLKFYIVLNTADEITKIDDVMARLTDYVDFSATADSRLQLSPIDQEVTPMLGAAIIVSKRNAAGWSNNNARFYPTELGEQLFYDQQYYQRALATYGPNGSTVSSDLFLRQADNDTSASDPNAVVSTDTMAIEVDETFVNPVLSSANAVIATLRSGVKAVVVNAAGKLVDANGAVISITFGEEGSRVTVELAPDATQFNGMRTVLYGSF